MLQISDSGLSDLGKYERVGRELETPTPGYGNIGRILKRYAKVCAGQINQHIQPLPMERCRNLRRHLHFELLFG